MIDEIAIVSVAGVILWSWANPELSASRGLERMINALFKDVLLREGRSREAHYDTMACRMKWRRSESRGVVVVAAYDKELARSHDFSYIDKVVASVAKTLEDNVTDPIGVLTESLSFDRQWGVIQSKLEALTGAPRSQPAATSHEASAASPAGAAAGDDASYEEEDGEGGLRASATSPRSPLVGMSDPAFEGLSAAERIALKRAQKKKQGTSRFEGKVVPGKGGKATGKGKDGAVDARGKALGGKALRGPAGGSGKLSAAAAAALNYGPAEDDSAAAGPKAEFGKGDVDLRVSWVDEEDTDDEDEGASSAGSWFRGTAFGRALSVFSGGHTLTASDLSSVGEELQEHLRTKNVTGPVAEGIVNAVLEKLVGTRAGAFDSMLDVVRSALRTSIHRLLTPRTHIDPISDARANAERAHGAAGGAAGAAASGFRPYVIVFTGINGVGKSTSLSKVIYHLKDSGLKPMVAACDTFRSGAVEQLRRHTDALEVPLFQQGYSKEPALVARAAIAEATKTGCDVVCVDTAGRMQSNRKLMQELASLVASNRPDLVLFVGEALAGSDSVDQLKEFNRSLVGLAPEGTSPRGVDGIFLTKCDTIDDKIGAAVSMVHETSIPIVFMGTGQRYTDMKRLNVDFVVQSLMR
ncbi:hypothetical protein FNF27_00856 [Cafeteria roenbergensis]|uniref:Signal recognition particle receptor subunit alpha homolog n=1 Tax=Cafeteria roenbergensis TaxID=33653 RepID=A0A5A8EK89_CAFRO|nr:hypothetical protein FNF27_00856 [Cafeteria roenbergensis]